MLHVRVAPTTFRFIFHANPKRDRVSKQAADVAEKNLFGYDGLTLFSTVQAVTVSASIPEVSEESLKKNDDVIVLAAVVSTVES